MSLPGGRSPVSEPDDEIGLGRRLARRLFPLALTIGLLISVGVPLADYIYDLRHLAQTASSTETLVFYLVSVALGAILAYLVYSVPIRTAAGMEGRMRDLIETLRRSNQESERLRAIAEGSDRYFRDIVQGVDAIVWAAELPSGRPVFVSERAEATLGYPAEEWLRDPQFWSTHVYPDDRERTLKAFESAAVDGRNVDIEHRFIAADGRVVWLRNRMRVVPEAEGRFRLLRGVMVDITESKRAEEELKKSQEQYRSLVDNVKQVIFQTDARGRWTLLNAAWTDVTGFSAEESLQRSFLDYVHPDDRLRQAELFQPLMTAAVAYVGQEIRYLTKAGGFRWVEVYSRVALDERGKVVGTFGTLTDITERRQAEEDLVTARERLRHLLVSSPAVIHSRHVHGDFPVTFVGQNITRLFGYEVDELLGDPECWASIIHPADAAEVLDGLSGIVEDGQQSHEYRLRRRDGAYRWVHDEWRLVRDAEGNPVEIVGSLVDITDQKQAEEERARLSSAVEQAGESIVITDPDGAIVYVNPSWERVTGYARAEVIGQNPRMLKSGKHDDEFYRTMWATLARGESWSGRLINRRKNGGTTEDDAAIFPVRDAAGRLVNYVGILRDVTREKQIEEQLRQSQKMEAVGRLAGGVAHDFNNLLTVITGRCGLVLQRLGRDNPASQDVDLVLKTAYRAAGLTRQLLAFSRKQVLTMRVLDLNAVVVNMEKMLHRLIGEDVELVTVLVPGLWRVNADPGQVEQIIMNLAINSRDAMPQGGRLTIETANVEEHTGRLPAGASPGPYAMLAVGDTGCGMDAETAWHVFEPFFTTKGADKGTGLGLSTVYGIVKQSGGEIVVESEPGRGTRLLIFLPRVEDPVEPVGLAGSGAKPVGGLETILLVEDDPEVRTLTREILEVNGYSVLEAADGAEALRLGAIHARPIHLVITDVVMPHVGGRHLAQQLGQLRPDTRILYISGYTDDAVIRHGVLAAEMAFLQKPFTGEALARKVREVLDAPSGPDHSRALHVSQVVPSNGRETT